MSHRDRSPIMAGDPRQVFQTQEKIGEGSYGSVHKALVRQSGQVAAVKIINLEEGEDLDIVLNEVKILQDCRHENIVAYFGCYMTVDERSNRQLWIGMEFCSAGSMEHIYKVTRRGYTAREIQSVMRQCLQGLAYLHGQRKIHRDLKCGNLLLTHDGNVKLADFGVSAQLTATLNKRKSVIGSPYWMAPEVISAEDKNEPYTEKADIWSIAITAIEMADCAPPLYDLHPMRALFMIPRNKPPTVADKTKWPADMIDFLAVCLKPKGKNRPDAKDLLKHPFIATGHPRPNAVIVEIVERYNQARASGQDSDDDEPVAASLAPAPVQQPITPVNLVNPLPGIPSPFHNPNNRPAGGPNIGPLAHLGPSVPVIGPGSPQMRPAPAVPVASNVIARNPNDTMVQYGQAPAAGQRASTQADVDSLISELVSMGFSPEQSSRALVKANNDIHEAISRLVDMAAAEETMAADEALARRLQQEEEDSRSTVAASPQAAADAQRYHFELISNMNADQFLCGDVWEEQLIMFLGTQNRLLGLDYNANPREPSVIVLSDRTYVRLMILEDIPIMVAISGPNRDVYIHDLQPLLDGVAESMQRGESRVARFESKTKVKKIGNTRDTVDFQIDRVGSSIFLLITRPNNVLLITHWAPHPYNKFMSVKEVTFDRPWNCVAVHESGNSQEGSDVKVVVGFQQLVSIIDLNNQAVVDVPIQPPTGLSISPLAALHFGTFFLLVFEDFCVPINFNGERVARQINLRNPATAAVKLGDESFALFTKSNALEVWHCTAATPARTFAHANVEKLRPLRLSKNYRALFVRIEVRADRTSRSAGIYSVSDLKNGNPKLGSGILFR